MNWNSFHNRGEILHAVMDAADARRDGTLPMDLAGVSENFHDELDLLACLLLKWHARLSGNVERELMQQPMDLELAVARAWRRTSDEMPGVRLVIDRCTDSPVGPEMANALARAHDREWMRLAAAAGLANDESGAAARAGQRIEIEARMLDQVPAAAPELTTTRPQGSLVERIKAVLAA